ncbi:coiled-coil domain-containing protein 115-like [Hylaeus anthracinus]|uniref:coiled-coil domain-containing protein 115-like n=1 Tax=Hylaeus volcanicus TaxID=313075 RepID=UPI0023B78480|nr:coiled-coil domain-containing protein 115-like [Hylaeus volcanicus]XP_053980940.1 coiled-coil domain-containing protein 115-like [Hylaeus volcanicus]XP_053980941.1 coiled-coil domain-containing protein 115-like [Hylaeus volcanicus]XP_054003905.1 coiled-coil domain-containing protein 115-like [Hylaeus anthracinus]XP_054003906.1 coiled-coil domain-containing protein 115-like [Hylaeus anthracinus]XP_054003907.1 coiled-coil domain-containing protein 115-like [Hylaeus anthracinus]
MHESIDDICKAIDENLLRNLELMEGKIIVNVQLENILRDGHIELAKAKYIRGKESISVLQIPDDDEKVATLFELETKITEETGKIIPNFDISLKKLDKDGGEIQDPIKWFGVLVPQSLRIAQKRFQESLYLVIRAANIQAELNSVLDKLKSLYFLKNDSCLIETNKK